MKILPILRDLRLTFFVFVVIGAAVILGFTVNADLRAEKAHWPMVAIVFGLMITYGVVLFVRSRPEGVSEMDAESFYYLGFIFTLLTLICTFYPMLGSEEPPDTRRVLGLFGLGLITTFVGLSGRIIFLQGSGSEPSDEGPERLARACNEAARQLGITTTEISRIGQGLGEVVRASHVEIARSVRDAMETVEREVSAQISSTVSSVSSLADEATQNISTLLTNAGQSVSTSLEDFQSRVQGLKLPPAQLGEALEKRLRKFVELSDTATASFGSLRDRLVTIDDVVLKVAQRASEAESAFQGLTRHTTDASAGIDSLNGTVSGLQAAASGATKDLSDVSAMSRQLSQSAQLLKDDSTKIHLASEVIPAALGEIAQSAQTIAPLVKDLQTEFGRVVERITALEEHLGKTEASIRQVNEAHASRARELEREIDVLRRYSSELETISTKLNGDLESSRIAVQKVHENLIDATQFVISKMQ